MKENLNCRVFKPHIAYNEATLFGVWLITWLNNDQMAVLGLSQSHTVTYWGQGCLGSSNTKYKKAFIPMGKQKLLNISV